MAVYCGDCGGESEVRGVFRVCTVCGCKTRLRTISGRTVRKPAMQNIPIRTTGGEMVRRMTPKKEPMGLDYEDLENRFVIGIDHSTKPPTVYPSKFTGGGVAGACHTCGNAFEECECPS